MLNIGYCHGFKIFMPEAEIIPRCRETTERARESNRLFLEQNPYPFPPSMPITGSFISAHPPDYAGAPALHWGRSDWSGRSGA